MSRRCRSTLAAVLIAVAGPGSIPPRAAEPDESATLRLSLAEAVERARAASPRIAESRALQDGAEARLRGARAGRMPEAEVTAGYTRNSEVPEFSTPGTPTSPPQVIYPNLPNQFRSRIAVALPLWTGGRVGGEIEAAEGNQSAAAFDRGAVEEEVVYDTTVAYWSLVAAREGEQVFAESVRAYDAHIQDALARQEVGLAARNEVLAVQGERDEAELALLHASTTAGVAEVDLARLLEVAPGSGIEPVESIEGAVDPPGEIEPLVLAALEARFDRAAAAARVEAAEARARVERSPHRPRLDAAAGYDYANPNWKIFPPSEAWDGTWDVGVSFSFTFLDGGRTAAAVDSAQAEVRAAQRRLEALDRRIRLEVTRGALELRQARAAGQLTLRSLEAARENVRVSQDRYREGLIPSSELLDAETTLLRAALARTNAFVQARIAAAGLDRALGGARR